MLPVIIVTGYGSLAEETKAKKIGISDFMHKPLSPDMIEESADKAMLAKEAIVEDTVVETIVEEAVASTEIPVQTSSQLKNVALFLCSPFIGLLYAVLLPFVGLGMLLYMGGKAALKIKGVRIVATLIAAPFIGLAFAIGIPFFGLGALAYEGAKAALKR